MRTFFPIALLLAGLSAGCGRSDGQDPQQEGPPAPSSGLAGRWEGFFLLKGKDGETRLIQSKVVLTLTGKQTFSMRFEKDADPVEGVFYRGARRMIFEVTKGEAGSWKPGEPLILEYESDRGSLNLMGSNQEFILNLVGKADPTPDGDGPKAPGQYWTCQDGRLQWRISLLKDNQFVASVHAAGSRPQTHNGRYHQTASPPTTHIPFQGSRGERFQIDLAPDGSAKLLRGDRILRGFRCLSTGAGRAEKTD